MHITFYPCSPPFRLLVFTPVRSHLFYFLIDSYILCFFYISLCFPMGKFRWRKEARRENARLIDIKVRCVLCVKRRGICTIGVGGSDIPTTRQWFRFPAGGPNPPPICQERRPRGFWPTRPRNKKARLRTLGGSVHHPEGKTHALPPPSFTSR